MEIVHDDGIAYFGRSESYYMKYVKLVEDDVCQPRPGVYTSKYYNLVCSNG